ncbi:MAG: hypothetical protein CM1200mP24_03680 [Gammaproteobacteria bacterium]|nr:MAG: hypothetical protein CM1200mP24_03680 [Gammaproteobacteria bacterium]
MLLGKQDYQGASRVFRELERLGSTVELDGLWLIAIFQEQGGLLGEEGIKIAIECCSCTRSSLYLRAIGNGRGTVWKE